MGLCDGLLQQLNSLRKQRKQLQQKIGDAEPGPDTWRLLNALKLLSVQVSGVQSAYDACVQANAPPPKSPCQPLLDQIHDLQQAIAALSAQLQGELEDSRLHFQLLIALKLSLTQLSHLQSAYKACVLVNSQFFATLTGTVSLLQPVQMSPDVLKNFSAGLTFDSKHATFSFAFMKFTNGSNTFSLTSVPIGTMSKNNNKTCTMTLPGVSIHVDHEFTPGGATVGIDIAATVSTGTNTSIGNGSPLTNGVVTLAGIATFSGALNGPGEIVLSGTIQPNPC